MSQHAQLIMQLAVNMLCLTSLKLLFITRDEQLEQCARAAQSPIVHFTTYLPACMAKLCRVQKGKVTLTGAARALAHSCHPLPQGQYSMGCASTKECKRPVASVAFPCASHTNFGLHASRSMNYIQAWLCMYSCMSLTRIGGQQSDGKALEDPAWMSY